VSEDLYGHLIETSATALIFSLGIPVFVLENIFPENLRPLVWKVKGFTIVPVVGLAFGYLYALYRACRGATSVIFNPGDLRVLVWLIFGLVVLNAIFFLFLCGVRPLEAALWLFKNRVLRAAHYKKIEYFDDFFDIMRFMAKRSGEAALEESFRQVLRSLIADSDYAGNSLDRPFACLKELFVIRSTAPHSSTSVEFILSCCREVVEVNERSTDPERPNCSDVALAWESAELLAISIIETGGLLEFKKATAFVDRSVERLTHVLWRTWEHKSSLKFASCVGSLSSSILRQGVVTKTAKARLLTVYSSLFHDSPWVSEGIRAQFSRLMASTMVQARKITVDEVVAQLGLGDQKLRKQVEKTLELLRLPPAVSQDSGVVALRKRRTTKRRQPIIKVRTGFRLRPK
jgi:hypothetical protein